MKTLIKFWAPLLILFLLSPKTINSQVKKRVLKVCERTTSSLFSNIDNIVFIKPNNVDYKLANVSYSDLSNKEIFTINLVALFNYFKKNFQTTSINKSQMPENLDANTLYVDTEKINIKVFQNTEKILNYNLKFVLTDSNEYEFEVKFDPSNWTKRKRQSWQDIKGWSHSEKVFYDGIARLIFLRFSSDVEGLKTLGKKLDNLIDNPSNLCKGNTKTFIGDTEIDIINFREAEKSFIKYWEKNYSKDPIEGIYSQTNYYSLFNVAETKGILKNDLYKIVIISDNSREFYNVYYLQNNKMELKIADLVAKIYKTNETNIFEIEYTNKFLQNDEFYNIQNTQMARSELSVDRLEFGSYKEPGTVKYGYSYRLSNHLYNFYEGESSKNYTDPWIGEMKGSPSENILIRASEGFFIKYNKFNNGIYFDAYFKRTFRPSEVQTASSTTNKPVNRKAKSSIKKKSAPPDAKTID